METRIHKLRARVRGIEMCENSMHEFVALQLSGVSRDDIKPGDLILGVPKPKEKDRAQPS